MTDMELPFMKPPQLRPKRSLPADEDASDSGGATMKKPVDSPKRRALE